MPHADWLITGPEKVILPAQEMAYCKRWTGLVLDWTLDWTLDWILDWTLDLIFLFWTIFIVLKVFIITGLLLQLCYCCLQYESKNVNTF